MHPLRYSTYSYFAVQNGVCETWASPGAGRKDQSLVSAAGQVAGCSTYVFGRWTPAAMSALGSRVKLAVRYKRL